MLTETLSGKCPCCKYDKLLQRYGSMGYFQLDGCPNCGFGYGTNHHDGEVFGVEAWLDYGRHILASVETEKYISEFEDDAEVVRTENGYMNNGGKTKESKAHDKAVSILTTYPDSKIRELIFEWCESTDRSDDVTDTVFRYSDEDVQKHLATNPVIFKQIEV